MFLECIGHSVLLLSTLRGVGCERVRRNRNRSRSRKLVCLVLLVTRNDAVLQNGSGIRIKHDEMLSIGGEKHAPTLRTHTGDGVVGKPWRLTRVSLETHL